MKICVTSLATSPDAPVACAGSAVTELAKGKTLREAKELKEEDVLILLGSIPESKVHCAKLAVLTLQKTIAKYEDEKRAHPKRVR
jgi:nitrogen fixation NifU-like protein